MCNGPSILGTEGHSLSSCCLPSPHSVGPQCCCLGFPLRDPLGQRNGNIYQMGYDVYFKRSPELDVAQYHIGLKCNWSWIQSTTPHKQFQTVTHSCDLTAQNAEFRSSAANIAGGPPAWVTLAFVSKSKTIAKWVGLGETQKRTCTFLESLAFPSP